MLTSSIRRTIVHDNIMHIERRKAEKKKNELKLGWSECVFVKKEIYYAC